ncbi:MAG: hypothetical protein KAT61_01585 [Gammaproteobacteria bacterium]|nr:hypothetical protein [Gammaproteobacteria bacterium]
MRFVDSKMQDSSTLHIVVPGICGPLAETQSLRDSHKVHQWLKYLSRSHCKPSQGNANDVIASILQLKFETDFPSAVLSLLANGLYDAELFYMHADPVHLRADMDHAILTSSVDLDVSDSDLDEIFETLNQHFNADGLNFFSVDKKRWFISSSSEIMMSTTPLVDAIGRNINFLLPAGEHATHWKQMLTEAQMLMHSHELNALRENAGQPSINSLWFHGSGKLPDFETDKDITLCSNHDVFDGLARHTGCRYMKAPDSVNGYTEYLLSCQKSSVNVLHLPELESLVNYTDVRPWMDQLAVLLEGWIYPLLKFANKNNISVTLYPCNEKRYQFSKYDVLKFWRGSELENHVNSY